MKLLNRKLFTFPSISDFRKRKEPPKNQQEERWTKSASIDYHNNELILRKYEQDFFFSFSNINWQIIWMVYYTIYKSYFHLISIILMIFEIVVVVVRFVRLEQHRWFVIFHIRGAHFNFICWTERKCLKRKMWNNLFQKPKCNRNPSSNVKIKIMTHIKKKRAKKKKHDNTTRRSSVDTNTEKDNMSLKNDDDCVKIVQQHLWHWHLNNSNCLE